MALKPGIQKRIKNYRMLPDKKGWNAKTFEKQCFIKYVQQKVLPDSAGYVFIVSKKEHLPDFAG